jgi:hypothetical protein
MRIASPAPSGSLGILDSGQNILTFMPFDPGREKSLISKVHFQSVEDINGKESRGTTMAYLCQQSFEEAESP